MDTQVLLKISADNEMHKTHKKRTKKIKAQLQDQIEFYFGDANLHKDRFMKQEMNKHPEGFVAISIIASFNRMKQITEDIKLVIKAIKMSSMLEVNEDDTMVRRKTPVPEPKNVDAETIYIEKLPPYADHDWLKGIFSKYGKVVYVSIPRFKQTGDVKGFAFVEFESAKAAQEAVEMFNKEGKHKQGSEPEEKGENGVNTEQSTEQHKTVKGKRKRSHSESEVEVQNTKKENDEEEQLASLQWTLATLNSQQMRAQRLAFKRKRQDSKSSEQDKNEKKENGEARATSEPDKKSKKSVRWQESEEQRDIEKEGSEVKAPRKRSHADSADDDETAEQKRQKTSTDKSDSNSKHSAEESSEDEIAKGSKKHKKRKRKRKEKKETKLPHLRVISKLEWLELKKEYKNLQREAMNNLKKQLNEKSTAEKSQAGHQTHKQPQGQGAASNKTSQSTSSQESSGNVKELPYTPGVVLKFHCQGLGMTKKELRDKFSSYAPVAYLDLAEGSIEGYVRFHTEEKCGSVFKAMSSTNDELKLDKLTKEDEKAYWEKINADRITRFNSKREKKRGTEKVARKAEALQVQRQSHIRFDDSGDEGET
ncbi:La- protein 7 [Desmophyllum pertusum]|uniref:La-related protein 7 n=1 Tax=Desmophyllum pertusum TaxID=174260 RepID=A0A9W9Z4D4_9CNID|nr:La- protein 7 [Desmophyllum pertusum]